MHSYIRPNDYVGVRLPSEGTRIIRPVPNTTVSLGKYGSFPANQIIGRPYHLTFEITETPDEDGNILRVVSAAELHAESLISDGSGEADGEGEELEMYGDGDAPMRTNREIVDDSSTQKMTLEEIEALKKEAGGAGREIIAKLLESHTALDQKTAFSLAKYTLRKRKKYMRRFTPIPLDVGFLTNYMLGEKDAAKIMELRDEAIGLIGCWGNVHHGGNTPIEDAMGSRPNSRYFVVDETGGLIVAAMAERMGILFSEDGDDEATSTVPEPSQHPANEDGQTEADQTEPGAEDSVPSRSPHQQPMSASGNTITLLHAHTRPNLSLLKYFGFDYDNPDESHPLFKHLKTVSWLQLVDPSTDPIYSNEPEEPSQETLSTMKASKRNAFYRKRNRWARTRNVVDEARAGGFDGLIVASLMEPATIMKYAVPLLTGSASVVAFSPTVEPLSELVDLYSTHRKTAFITQKRQIREQDEEDQVQGLAELEAEFIVDPSLLVAASVQTSRVRSWQVLPGRTHPLMSSRGGPEGYIFHAIRVLPAQDHIQAAGNQSRKRRKVSQKETTAPATTATDSGDANTDIQMRL
ncbi:hypothetical protein ASPZODRAFT_99213 [Penicilliopsis zonata CBS 506.65]|uniref:tRNA (adenine(58)-N(1))-methyltransferase non-catalytic subunit TRM6 n=1 Tax=Penicilliopsis zonata CBS 506.65 TaxID=1073090 RepID=A0A1L9SDP5_9EURO|nr:hypothetical protein ASPZODRAFT_99213 [Penicilliopsis zonata CBS 506.65]OJJ45299.1 hypothetical protein ASPZODRAFT_99213 [Penicilliopsis zonata CBS 506.65]